MQKQPSRYVSTRGVPRKRCSENIQQIYGETPRSKCDFKVALQLCRNRTSALSTRKIAPWKNAPGRSSPTLTLTQTLTLSQGEVYWGRGVGRGNLVGGQFSGHAFGFHCTSCWNSVKEMFNCNILYRTLLVKTNFF